MLNIRKTKLLVKVGFPMPNMLDTILRSIIQSLGIIESESVQLKALIGTPHDVEATKIDTLRKF